MSQYVRDWELTAIVGSLGAFIIYWLGGWDVLLQSLIALVVLDYIAGVLLAAYQGRLSSDCAYKGLIRKLAMFVALGAATALDQCALLGTPWLRNVMVALMITKEAMSVLENLALLGVPIPQQVRDALAVLRDSASPSAKRKRGC